MRILISSHSQHLHLPKFQHMDEFSLTFIFRMGLKYQIRLLLGLLELDEAVYLVLDLNLVGKLYMAQLAAEFLPEIRIGVWAQSFLLVG